MFNSTNYVKMVVHSDTHSHFQQVSGSLIKTHPDSVFIRFQKGSPMEKEVFSIHPRLDISPSSYDTVERDITVLQILLSHDEGYVCEVVVHYKPGDRGYKAPTEEEQK